MAAEPSQSGKSLLQAIAQQDPDVTYLLDRFCRIQYVRGAGENLVRTGADLFETIPETQRESVRDCLNGVRESGDTRRFDVLLGGSRDQLWGMPLVNFVNQEDSHHMRETLTSVIGRHRPSASLAVGIVGRPSPVRWSMSMSHRTESVVLVATMPELTDGPEATGLVDPGAVEKVQSTLSIAAEVARESMSEPHKSQTASSGSTGEASIGVASASGQDSTEATPLAASPTLATVTENSEPTSQSGLEIVDLYVQEFNSRLMSIMKNVQLGRLSEDPGRVKLYLPQVEQEARRASEMTRKMVSRRDEPAWNRDTVPDERHFIRTSQRIVLIAEDDELVPDVVVKILEQASYRVLVCRNGKETVEMCHRHDDIDLIFLDVVMPVTSGSEAASQITLIRPEIPLLFTSGFVGDSLTNANIPTGAPLLKKPYQTDALLKVIEEHIGPAQCTVDSEGTSGR